MPAIGEHIQPNTPEEEAAIQRRIDMDPTTYVLTDDQFLQLKPFRLRMNEFAESQPDAG
jgi:hypothetical protein